MIPAYRAAARRHRRSRGFFADDFNDNVRDPAKWATPVTNALGTIAEQNGRIEWTLPADNAAYGVYQTAATYDLTPGRFVRARVGSAGVGGMLRVMDAAFNIYELTVIGANLCAAHRLAGGATVSLATVALNLTTQAYWRLRYAPADGKIHFEYAASPLGPFTDLFSETIAGADHTAMTFAVGAERNGGTAGSGWFDDLVAAAA